MEDCPTARTAPMPASVNGRSFDGWQNYPANLPAYNPLVTDGGSLSRLMRERAHKLFDGKAEAMDVEIFETNVPDDHLELESAGASHRRFSSEHSLESHLLSSPVPKTRIMTIAQQHSLAPLGISEQLMRKILTYHQATPDLLNNIFACGDHPQASDAGSGNFSYRPLPKGAYELMYTLQYVEKNCRSQGNPWSTRQTTIYHQRSTRDEHVWLVLHPRKDSKMRTRFKNALFEVGGLRNVGNDPISIHLLLLSSYASGWREYLGNLSDAFLDAADFALTMDLEDNAEYRLSFETLQSLRHLADKVLPLVAFLRASITTIERIDLSYRDRKELGKAEDLRDDGATRLSYYSCQLQGNLRSAKILQQRVQGILDLLANALNAKSQATAAELSKHMLGLTKKTVDDSATVRVVGIVSLIYLPATFTATILGMDLFTYETATSKLGVARDFWIYLAISIPLTILTLGCWVMLLIRKKICKAARDTQDMEKSTDTLGV